MQKTEKSPWPYGTTYEIFVQSFADSNGDGIGDIIGMTKKLDYLSDLGIQAIWLMPIHPSPSYHKYDVTDYYAIHPDYGSKEDFKQFISEAHKRDIKVIIDMVVNHTSWDHPWFRESVKGPENAFRDYYVWANIDSIQDQIAKKEVTLDSDNIRQWHQWQENEEYYYGFFYRGMPDLNFDNPKVRSEIIAIGKHWINEYDVDGFRLDAAKHIYPDERAEDCHAWWQEFGDAMRLAKEDFYLVGEVWGTPQTIGPFMSGLGSMFDFDLYHNLKQILINENNDDLIESLLVADKVYRSANDQYVDAIFVNNHDRTRIIDEVGGSLAKSQLATAIILTLPGMPYIYYGDEIGMFGKKPDEYIREPFIWDKEGEAVEQTRWITAKNSTYDTVVPLSEQLKNANSTYNFFKYWIKQRNLYEALRIGSLNSIRLPTSLIGFTRITNGQKIAVVHNLSANSQTISLNTLGFNTVLASFNNSAKIMDGQLILPGYASVLLE